jgi:hypothetical protein
MYGVLVSGLLYHIKVADISEVPASIIRVMMTEVAVISETLVNLY